MNKLKALTTNLALAVPGVYAQGQAQDQIDLNPPPGWENLGGITVAKLVSGLIKLSLVVVALVFFAMLIWGGIRWITSRGDKTEVENARNQVTHALIGLAIVFVAWAIVQLIKTLFGVDILTLDIPNLYQ